MRAQVLFELRRCQFCWLAQQGRSADALRVVRTQLTPLAEAEPRWRAEVKAAMLGLIPGGPPGPALPAVASVLQAALRKALGFEVRSQLVFSSQVEFIRE